MKRFFRCAAVAMAASVVLAPASAHALTKDDILEMARAGLSPSIIVETTRLSGEKFKFTPAELAELRGAGIGDDAIREMTGGPIIKAPAGGAAAGAAKPAGPQDQARRAAEEFRREEEARKAEEARRASEVRRVEAERLRKEAARLRAEAAEMALTAKQAELQAEARKSEIDRALREAFEKLDRGDHADAAVRFRKFLRGGLVPPNSFRYVEGEYGLGESLFRGGFEVGSIPHFVEVLRRGPVTRRFGPALLRLGEATARIVYDHPIFELLATFDVGPLPLDVRDEHAFFLGQFYVRFADRERARASFDRVSPASGRYAAARYHLGILDVGDSAFKTAVARFEESARAARSDDLRDLAYMALARIAHENEAWGGATFYYGKVGRRSPRAAQARYELLWTSFMKQDWSRAIGLVHALDSPFYSDAFLPDLRVLEATVYVNLCRFKEARAVAAEARTRLDPVREQLRKFLRPRDSIDAYYRALEKETLPAQVHWALDRDLEYVALRETVRRVEAEQALLRKAGRAELVEELAPAYKERRALLLELAGLSARRALRDLLGQVQEMQLRTAEVLFEVELAEKERLLDETMRLAQGKDEAGEAKRPARESVTPAVAKNDQPWPFEGEYWEDELDAYRSGLSESCGQ
ncbi:MAG: hypothetical protein AABZ30_10295 [Myxococcota bacterium]